MTNSTHSLDSVSFELSPADNPRLANLCGHMDEHIRMLERGFGVEINNRGINFQIIGPSDVLVLVQEVIHDLYADTADHVLQPEQIHLAIRDSGGEDTSSFSEPDKEVVIKTKRGLIKARGDNQQAYLRRIMTHDINFGVGPAGTGKTYLAVACAVEALERDFARRIVLVRPAVEAGERLGFLPGDLAQKVDPYLRPLYDALYEMLGFEKVAKLMDRLVIEVAPLAFMRGRTLNNSFVILDEAQNTTPEQMKMFLTRIGFGSKAVITGDVTQVDLPRHQKSGLVNALEVLAGEQEIGVTRFDSRDVVRHPLVQRIVEAYDRHERDTDPQR